MPGREPNWVVNRGSIDIASRYVAWIERCMLKILTNPQRLSAAKMPPVRGICTTPLAELATEPEKIAICIAPNLG